MSLNVLFDQEIKDINYFQTLHYILLLSEWDCFNFALKNVMKI